LSLKSEVWHSVIQAIEKAIPEYDSVNERVSLGRAQETRDYAVEHLELQEGMIILDAGIGPGTMSQTILQQTTQLTIVGLDASLRLLDAARERLKTNHSDHLHLIRGVFEALPFKERSFSRIVSAYAFRDARNRRAAIDEFHRVGSENSIFAIVDLGKPENRINRSLISFYVRNVMPFIARLVMSGSVEGNPWRMIFPTYQALGSNRELVEALSKLFNDVILREFALGGAIVVLARRTDPNLQQK
jgi:demethylmenaquinone methyltransferase/2-methoxy-6-polyprenyl-1,4-benzoquinol methylase